MAVDNVNTERPASSNVFDCDSLPIAQGTKNHARLGRGEETRTFGAWWLIGGVAMASAVIGILIGHFILH